MKWRNVYDRFTSSIQPTNEPFSSQDGLASKRRPCGLYFHIGSLIDLTRELGTEPHSLGGKLSHSAERERFDEPIGAAHHTVHHVSLVKALGLQVVGVIWAG